MGLLAILKIISAVLTILTGLLALVKPKSIYGFTGLRAEGGRGITEIRSIFGALFIALGGVAIYFQQAETYMMLGMMYLAIFIVRLFSMFVDKSVERSNLVSLATEAVLGVILVFPG